MTEAIKDNVIRVRVEEFTFRKIMAVAKENKSTMSEVVRLCVAFSLDKVVEFLKTSNAVRDDFLNKK